MIEFKEFPTKKELIAPVIYRETPHQTTNNGVVLSNEITNELSNFLALFNKFLKVQHDPYFRIDAYFDINTGMLYILEINASFVDGWGTALNLARASEIQVDQDKIKFPCQFATTNDDYLPELELLQEELEFVGHEKPEIMGWNNFTKYNQDTYLYGRNLFDQGLIFPKDGIRLDNKLHLGLFSTVWDGRLVKIPTHYMSTCTAWEDIPKTTVLKFCDKGSTESTHAGSSVIFGKPEGKARFLKRCYNDVLLLAQDHINAEKFNDNNCQLVILSIGANPITGYVQYSSKMLINDNSTHGPLQLGN